MQRTLEFAIVDEVDSILIDEARTPLIISGPAEESTELYLRINELVPRLKRQGSEEGEGDYWAEEKSKQVHLSDTVTSTSRSCSRRPGSSARARASTTPATSGSCIT